eukprot:TRINITY_DN2535_c0_g2_i1.p1 TRINITY_DN2535_c0_g2~~TRINITY_DN2535_c0_g2_i1.p1  ORF type:complete len:428 (-),score=71.16 TRINITY_DN2535_c0_g2_i1:9-1292(-)
MDPRRTTAASGGGRSSSFSSSSSPLSSSPSSPAVLRSPAGSPQVTRREGGSSLGKPLSSPLSTKEKRASLTIPKSGSPLLGTDLPSMGGLSLKSGEKADAGGFSRRRLPARLVLGDEKDDSYSIRFSPDARFIAAGSSDGSVRVYSSLTGKLVYNLTSDDNLPITCVRWRPESLLQKNKNILVSTNADGAIRHWHVTSNKCINTLNEDGNQIYCVDYRFDGDLFATAGKDFKVRVYDENKKALLSTLSGGHGDVTAGHASRVFSLKFHPTDQNILLTGGWDNTIQLWDLRMDHAVRSIFGPHICGDSVDIYNNLVISGSWRQDKSLQLWDYGDGRLLDTIEWKVGLGEEPCLIYATQFSKGNDAEYIVAGGSGSNEFRVFNRKTSQVVGGVWGLKRGVYAVDFSYDSKSLIVGGGGMLHLYEMHLVE